MYKGYVCDQFNNNKNLKCEVNTNPARKVENTWLGKPLYLSPFLNNGGFEKTVAVS